MIEQYKLYDSKKEGRFIITTELLTDANHEAGTFAESWLDAKQRLGFDLTDEQKRLLAKQGIPLWRRGAA